MLEVNLVADDLVGHGYALLSDDGTLMPGIQRAFKAGLEFFAGDRASKIGSAVPSILEGYLPLTSEFSQTQDRPDLCESFAVWRRNAGLAPTVGIRKNVGLHQQMSALLPLYTVVANAIFDALRLRIEPLGMRLEAAETSYLQMNHYRPADYERDMLQDPHEDGHLLTMLRPTAPGAEILANGEFKRIAIADDQLLLMPGSLMTIMTGGLIPPLVHRVRNDRSTAVRQSLMYFINPTLSSESLPWVENDSNRGISVREAAVANSRSFGLPSLEEAIPRPAQLSASN